MIYISLFLRIGNNAKDILHILLKFEITAQAYLFCHGHFIPCFKEIIDNEI